MAKPLLKVFISYAPDYPDWAIEGVVDMLRSIKYERTTPYELAYGYAGSHPEEGVVPDHHYSRHSEVHLKEADMVLVLVTQAYFESEYVKLMERPLIEKRLEGSTYPGVIPIIVEPSDYAFEWLSEYQLRTIPYGPEMPLSDGQALPASAKKWSDVDKKLSERLLGLSANIRAKQRSDQRIKKLIVKQKREEEGYGTVPYLVFVGLLAIIIASTTIDVAKFYKGPRRSHYVQEQTFRATLDLATRPLLEQETAAGAASPGQPVPDPDFKELIEPDQDQANIPLPDTYGEYGAKQISPRGNNPVDRNFATEDDDAKQPNEDRTNTKSGSSSQDTTTPLIRQ